MISQNTTRRQKSTPDSLGRGNRIPLNKRIDALIAKMRSCAANNKPLNFSESAHREITEALRIVAYDDDSASREHIGQQVKVVYGDGSKGLPIKIRCLSPCQEERIDEKRSLHVGTLSFRHLDYDGQIDLYLIRDRETRTLSNGEVDKLAYDRMKELVQDSTLRKSGSRLVLFQTGLEPLIIGAYRAVIEELMIRRSQQLPTLVVQPVFFADDQRTGNGKAWS